MSTHFFTVCGGAGKAAERRKWLIAVIAALCFGCLLLLARRWCGSQYTRYFFSGLYAAAWSFPLFFGAVWLAPFSGLRHRSGRQTASETLGEVLPLAGIGFFLALF